MTETCVTTLIPSTIQSLFKKEKETKLPFPPFFVFVRKNIIWSTNRSDRITVDNDDENDDITYVLFAEGK